MVVAEAAVLGVDIYDDIADEIVDNDAGDESVEVTVVVEDYDGDDDYVK